jgi:protein-tyrosine phosphatase
MSPARLPNGRDIGGLRGFDGRLVSRGLVFRSGMIASPDSAAVLELLGVGRVFDLRTEPERTARPDQLPTSAELVVADVLADDPGSGAASLGKIARTVLTSETEMMTAQELQETFRAGYRSFVSLNSAQRASHDVLAATADPDAAPMVVHCTAGKDRTGWLIALILLSIGVSEDQVMDDYLASAEPVWELFAPHRDEFERRGGDIETMRIAIGVFPDYLEGALDEIASRYGSLDSFLNVGLGLPEDFRQQLTDRLLEA